MVFLVKYSNKDNIIGLKRIPCWTWSYTRNIKCDAVRTVDALKIINARSNYWSTSHKHTDKFKTMHFESTRIKTLKMWRERIGHSKFNLIIKSNDSETSHAPSSNVYIVHTTLLKLEVLPVKCL